MMIAWMKIASGVIGGAIGTCIMPLSMSSLPSRIIPGGLFVSGTGRVFICCYTPAVPILFALAP